MWPALTSCVETICTAVTPSCWGCPTSSSRSVSNHTPIYFYMITHIDMQLITNKLLTSHYPDFTTSIKLICACCFISIPCLCSDCPPRFWWYRWFCFFLSIFGLICILLGHEHYSIDVVVAYFVVNWTFRWYYAMLESHVSRHTLSYGLVPPSPGFIQCSGVLGFFQLLQLVRQD